MRQYLIGAFIGGVTVVTIECVAYFVIRSNVFGDAMARGGAFHRYSFVLEYFRESGTPLPDSFDELIGTYNASPSGKDSPITSESPRVLYRPPNRLRNGPYLVLIEDPVSASENINVIYAYPDGETDTQKIVLKEELEILIRDDDRRREVGARALSQPASRP